MKYLSAIVLLFFSMNNFVIADYNNSVKSKLEQKMAFKPSRNDFTLEKLLNRLAKQSNIDFYVKESAKPKLSLVFKKFAYPNVKAKYVLYRLMKEASLSYKIDGSTIYIY